MMKWTNTEKVQSIKLRFAALAFLHSGIPTYDKFKLHQCQSAPPSIRSSLVSELADAVTAFVPVASLVLRVTLSRNINRRYPSDCLWLEIGWVSRSVPSAISLAVKECRETTEATGSHDH